jgi:hypothetical protein
MTIKITDDMLDLYAAARVAGKTPRGRLAVVLENITPEAKRDLAAQLLRSANEAEGHPEGAPNEDAMDRRKLDYGRCDAPADTPGYTCALAVGHDGRHALGNGWQFDASARTS